MPKEPDRPQPHEPPTRGVPPQGLATPQREGGVQHEPRSFKDKAGLAADRTPSPTPEKPQRQGGMIEEGSSGSRPRQQGGMIGDG